MDVKFPVQAHHERHKPVVVGIWSRLLVQHAFSLPRAADNNHVILATMLRKNQKHSVHQSLVAKSIDLALWTDFLRCVRPLPEALLQFRISNHHPIFY
ncbi:unnamed protein product [Urochloa humidicola]